MDKDNTAINGTQDLGSMKKELEEIKAEKMRRELEDIKKERMRRELEEIRSEKARNTKGYVKPDTGLQKASSLSILNVIFASLSLILSGYILGIMYGFDIVENANGFLTGLSLPAIGEILLLILVAVLILLGAGLITISKK
ncbi:hypothetical protein CUJ83_01170 [Methanocella sp. CWC-04]|uniref:Uncharacterized protein n=1 Tax=Methanooceanicella nereidis TaxID=2052831 RepID=A0AAP2W4R3_9EURY|nr:hypothetical protein [Methanocella sp. CWC-04]MCD1293608.1 hypothetical protein [Methanocella sp. CWC-04]